MIYIEISTVVASQYLEYSWFCFFHYFNFIHFLAFNIVCKQNSMDIMQLKAQERLTEPRHHLLPSFSFRAVLCHSISCVCSHRSRNVQKACPVYLTQHNIYQLHSHHHKLTKILLNYKRGGCRSKWSQEMIQGFCFLSQ